MEVNIHEAKTHLSRLLDRVTAGEEVIIAKAGKPIARLVPVHEPAPVLGGAAGTITFHPGWDDPLSDDEISALFGQ